MSSKNKIDALIDNAISLKSELVQLLSDSTVTYEAKPSGVVGWWGDYKIIPKDDGRKQKFMTSFNVWVENVGSICRSTEEFQELWDIRNHLQGKWNMHKQDINLFVRKIEFVFESIIRLLEEEAKYL